MRNVLIINAHHPYPFSQGKLNATLTEKARTQLSDKGYNVRTVKPSEGFEVEQALEDHNWADIVILQTPLNWMGVPWSFKQYMDEVYSAGMGGALCEGDGRTSDNPKANYGRGGTQSATKYMLSVTANAPAEAFADEDDFFEGKTLDDLLFPMHMNFKFFGMQPLPTFAAYDVMKNAQVDADLSRFEDHINKHF